MLDKILTIAFCITSLIFLTTRIAVTKEIDIQTNNSRLSIDRNGHIIIETPNIPTMPTTVVPNRSSQTRNTSYQQTSITVNSSNLKQPHLLKIDSLAKQISGEITLDGRTIRKLTGNKTQIDLASYLTKGEHRLEISLNYLPVASSVSISFSAPGTNMMQQTSGNGNLKHNLLITVK
jgi:hypothetical protein